MLYAEIVSRRFTDGILEGCIVPQTIHNLSKPRNAGEVHKGISLSGSGYEDFIICVREERAHA